MWDWEPAVLMYKAARNPLNPGKKHYQLYVNPWLESGDEHRLEAWVATSLRPGELAGGNDDLDMPGARFTVKDGFKRAQEGFLVLTETRLIHETPIMPKAHASHGVGLAINALNKRALNGTGPIMFTLGQIVSLDPVPDSGILRITTKTGDCWRVSIGSQLGRTPKARSRPSEEKRDEVLSILQSAHRAARHANG
jgi:hypothetical protein